MTGREKCDKLKAIRRAVASRIGVELHQTECHFEGECTGTCPKCRQEEKILNEAIIHKGTAVAGMTLIATSLAACTPVDRAVTRILGGDEPVEVGGGGELAGDVSTIDDPVNENGNAGDSGGNDDIFTQKGDGGESIFTPDGGDEIELDGDVSADYESGELGIG